MQYAAVVSVPLFLGTSTVFTSLYTLLVRVSKNSSILKIIINKLRYTAYLTSSRIGDAMTVYTAL